MLLSHKDEFKQILPVGSQSEEVNEQISYLKLWGEASNCAHVENTASNVSPKESRSHDWAVLRLMLNIHELATPHRRLGLTKAEGADDSEWCMEAGCGVRNTAAGQGDDTWEMLTFSLCCESPGSAQRSCTLEDRQVQFPGIWYTSHSYSTMSGGGQQRKREHWELQYIMKFSSCSKAPYSNY